MSSSFFFLFSFLYWKCENMISETLWNSFATQFCSELDQVYDYHVNFIKDIKIHIIMGLKFWNNLQLIPHNIVILLCDFNRTLFPSLDTCTFEEATMDHIQMKLTHLLLFERSCHHKDQILSWVLAWEKTIRSF